jgi:hypothetical protein
MRVQRPFYNFITIWIVIFNEICPIVGQFSFIAFSILPLKTKLLSWQWNTSGNEKWKPFKANLGVSGKQKGTRKTNKLDEFNQMVKY